MISMEAWRTEFKRRDHCPWPGPRPLEDNEQDRTQLVGRRHDLDEVVGLILSNRVVVLSGESGVGKSSFLNAGLIRELDDAQRFPLVCNRYVSAADDPQQMVFDELQTTEQLDDLKISTLQGDLFEQLEGVLEHRAVLVLDQFEELIRKQEGLVEPVIEMIERAVRSSRCHIVLSLRSEYEHRLAPLLQVLDPFATATHRLTPIRDDLEVQTLISSGNTASETRITGQAAEALLAVWQEQQRGLSTWQSVGLLQLQAALYSLYSRADGVIEPTHVSDLAEEAEQAGLGFFAFAMRAAIRQKLTYCEEACGQLTDRPRQGADDSDGDTEPRDRPLEVGTKELVRRLSSHVSSGDYKLVQRETELVLRAVSPELDRLCPGEDLSPIVEHLQQLREPVGTPKEVSVEVADLLTSGRDEVLRATGRSGLTHDLHPNVAASGLDCEPWRSDPHDVSSGAMQGLASQDIAVEELRRGVFALEWLDAAKITRRSGPRPGRSEVSLIHDGFGEALKAWAADTPVGPATAIHRLTAARGESFVWRGNGSSSFEPEPEAQGHRLIVNVRWQDCQITSEFRRVTFLNCDFRGSRFQDCRFEGVTFVNCLLDHASFIGCEIVGPVSDPDLIDVATGDDTETPHDVRSEEENPSPDETSKMPSFLVRGAAAGQVAREHRRYRTGQVHGEVLYSPTSGVPALGTSSERHRGWAIDTDQADEGGLTIYGGRLNSLVVRACEFVASGTLAMNYIAGSSLDIVEQAIGSFSIRGAAIRGLTITRPVELVSASSEDGLRVRIQSSVLANTWLGEGLCGKVEVTSSQLWQLWNLSDPQDLRFELGDCGYTGLVNVPTPSDPKSGPLAEARDPFDVSFFSSSALAMDFRSKPARFELLQGE